MAFDVNTITIKGAQLLAAATAQNRLILDGCDATTTFIDQNTAVSIETRPASPFSNTTDVTIIGSTSNHVMARAHFEAGQSTGGEANTLYLYGHSSSAPSDIFVIYVCSSQETFHLPETGDVITGYEALFDMIYSAVEGIVTTASTSVFCTLAEFNILKNRVVTTHKEDNISSGDNQVVYGMKQFMDYVLFSDEISASRLLAGTTTFSGHVKCVQDEEHPDVPQIDIGESSNPFRNLYVKNIYTNGDFTTRDISANSLEIGTIRSDAEVYSVDLYVSGGIEADTIEPYTDQGIGVGVGKVGSFNYPYNELHAGGLCMLAGYVGIQLLDGNYPVVSTYYGETTTGGVTYKSVVSRATSTTYTSIMSDGTANRCIFSVTLNNIDRLKISYNSNSGQYETEIETPLNVSGSVNTTLLNTTGGITGTQPTYSGSTTTVKVGSIVMAWIRPNLVSGNYFRAGETYHSSGTSSDTSTTLEIAESANNTFKRSTYSRILPNGIYAFLSDVDNSVATCTLVQCLSLD